MWEYELGGDLPRSVALLRSVDMDGEYLHRFGYGALDFRLAQLLEPKYADVHRYEISLREDQTYSVTCFFKDRTGTWVDQPSQAFVIDPAQGYLIIENVMFEDGGKPFRVIKVKGEEVSPGIWFPMRVELKEFDESATTAGGEPKVITLKQYAVRSIDTKPTFQPDTFTWKSLGLPPGTLVHRTDRLGVAQVMVVENGELVPRELATGQGSSQVR
jgi:hypothetical protein